MVKSLHYFHETAEVSLIHEWGRFGLLNAHLGISKIGEDEVQIVAEVGVTDKAYLGWVRVLFKKRADLCLIKPHVKCSEASAVGSFSTIALAEFVKVNEELSDTDSVFGSEGLKSLLNIQLSVQLGSYVDMRTG